MTTTITRIHADRIQASDTLIFDEDKGHGATVVAVQQSFVIGLVEVHLHAGPCILLRPDEVVTIRRR